MEQEAKTSIFTEVADKLASASLIGSIGRVGVTALSFATPPKERLYRSIRGEYKKQPAAAEIPLQPVLEQTVLDCEQVIEEYDPQTSPLLNDIQLTQFVGTMFQFSDRTPFIRPAMATPYRNIASIYEQTVESARHDTAVSHAESLQFALHDASDIPSALWNLFLTSRQFARWRDSDAIIGMPNLSRAQKLDRMRLWESSLAACKQPDKNGYQDVAGDAYYVWTHALARTIYDALPAEKSVMSEFYKTAFTQGSRVMGLSRRLGVVSVLGTMSDHMPASCYGNAIGQLCADKIKSLHSQGSVGTPS